MAPSWTKAFAHCEARGVRFPCHNYQHNFVSPLQLFPSYFALKARSPLLRPLMRVGATDVSRGRSRASADPPSFHFGRSPCERNKR
eukprot:1564553-Pyramimonas_sp.AAC.1